ncbi:MAG: radical SAM protein [bacterium]
MTLKEMKIEDRNRDRAAPLSRPPVLAGYIYDPEEAYGARNSNRLLAIRLETSRSCNLRCRYCYAESGGHLEHELDFEDLTSVIRQAWELGADSVVVIGGGEPTLYPRFRDLIAYIHSLRIIPVIFTNTVTMTRELAEFLHDQGASVMGKLDSLRPEVQDYLAGQAGAFHQIQEGLNNLIEAGFTRTETPHRLRMGVSFVSGRLNVEEVEEIWHFCRQRRIFPNIEFLTPTGRARQELSQYILSPEEIKNYKLRLLEIDQDCYGHTWLPYTPLTASGCLQHLYSLYVTGEGNVRPCAPTKFDEHPDLEHKGTYPHNVRRRSLRKIYEDPLFQYVRNIDRYLEGKCRQCEHLNECIGCRGYTYSVGVNEGKDPCSALRAECLQCFK